MVIAFSFILAFLLAMLPLPDWANMYRPDWVVLVLIYWCLYLPERIGAGVAWLIGLMLDITQANLLGLNALGLSLVGYLANRFHLRLRMFPWWQQAISVLVLLVLYRGLVGWIRGFFSPVVLDYAYWLPCLIGMLVSPWLFVILRDARRYARRYVRAR